MSGSNVQPTPEGRGTHPGGNNERKRRGNSAQAAVANQPLLVLDSNLLDHLDAVKVMELAAVQLRFARDVSLKAAEAYESILKIVGMPTEEIR